MILITRSVLTTRFGSKVGSPGVDRPVTRSLKRLTSEVSPLSGKATGYVGNAANFLSGLDNAVIRRS